mgnify:CR=1 FL=1
MKTKQVIKLLRVYIPKWIDLLKLQNWLIDINYMKGDGEIGADGFRTSATCDTNWDHLSALICFWPRALRDSPKTYIEYVVVHELMHIVVNEMRETGVKHEERVVSHLAKSAVGISNA